MNDLKERILTDIPLRDTASIYYMGQSGIIIKSSTGRIIAVDIYLSDCCERYYGFKRLAPKLLGPDDIDFDVVLASSASYDHFDVDSMPFLIGGKTVLLASEDCQNECMKVNIPLNRVVFLKKNAVYKAAGFEIRTIECSHGLMGFIIRIGGKTVYFTGDTAFSEATIKDALADDREIDVLFLPINGTLGNLNAATAARFASQINARLTVPCHYWCFAEHGGNPSTFAEIMKTEYPKLDFMLMAPGERIVI